MSAFLVILVLASQAPPAVDAPSSAPMAQAAPKAAVERPQPQRKWWAKAGLAMGLTVAAASVPVVMLAGAVQMVALYLWVQQAQATGTQFERDQATMQARVTQVIALVLLGVGLGGFVTGAWGGVYLLGRGTEAPKRRATS
ncbi:MAG: hypothetical protein AB2A00_42650 [Myxococcota bacterium]